MALQKGDSVKIKCPHCKALIAPPHVVKSVQKDQILEVTGTCMRCGKENHFWARIAIVVEAEREDRVR